VVQLNLKPDVYAVFQKTGVPMHFPIELPKGQYWLRTGVYDQGSRKVGTMELRSVPWFRCRLRLQAICFRSVARGVSTKDAAILPARPAEKVTVEQLEHRLAAAQRKEGPGRGETAGGMELSERLNSEKLAKIEADLPGEKSRMALLAMADASAFLQLPAAEIPATAPPDVDTERLILKKAAENVIASVQKFPDFVARETTNRFHDLKLTTFCPMLSPPSSSIRPFNLWTASRMPSITATARK
jgi:hypothetical protein